MFPNSICKVCYRSQPTEFLLFNQWSGQEQKKKPSMLGSSSCTLSIPASLPLELVSPVLRDCPAHCSWFNSSLASAHQTLVPLPLRPSLQSNHPSWQPLCQTARKNVVLSQGHFPDTTSREEFLTQQFWPDQHTIIHMWQSDWTSS